MSPVRYNHCPDSTDRAQTFPPSAPHPMDQLWKEVKKEMATNRRFQTIDAGADHAENWIQSLGRWQVFQK
ncbi:MAG TPA: hypothetical protein VFC07_03530 [Verrucomicrobiae bacterium]|nr:hypothetical protein [Verrucomicrobiae bacterium]